jgi:hypothetical protein
MSKSRVELLSRLATLRNSLQEANLADGLPTDVKKNEIAAMLRSGMAVLVFAITEAFVRERTAEILKGFSNSAVRFGDLSEKLQRATTIRALEGVLFRAKLRDPVTQVPWVLAELPAIANAATNLSNLSAYSFGQNKSNLSDEDVPAILTAFGVDGNWNAISEIAKRVGLGGVPDYKQSFKDLAARRHRAAHDVSTSVPLNDLNDSVNSVLGICCAFDLLLSHALSMHNISQFPSKAGAAVTHQKVKLRFITPHPTLTGKFREQTELVGAGHHTVKIHATLADAVAAALPKCKTNQEGLVYLTANGIPENWNSW